MMEPFRENSFVIDIRLGSKYASVIHVLFMVF